MSTNKPVYDTAKAPRVRHWEPHEELNMNLVLVEFDADHTPGEEGTTLQFGSVTIEFKKSQSDPELLSWVKLWF